MSNERTFDSDPSMFGGSGNPNVTVTPWSPETAGFEESTGSRKHWEAYRSRVEAQMDTPEGRKKDSEMKRAETREKEMNWAFRVILDRKNGWKPIWGSAKDEELRIYTLTKTGEHRFWGIKPIGMDIFDFWHKYDPEVKRYDDRQQETPVNPDAPVGRLIGEPPKNLTTKEAAAKPVKRQKTPGVKSTRRVRKSTAPSRTPGMNRTKGANMVSASQQKKATEYEGSAKCPGEHPASKAKAATKDVTMPPKHPRGRPLVEKKPTGRLPKQKKMPAVKGNASVQKSPKADRPRPLAPSVHKMRTRGNGPAEFLRLP